MRKDFLVVHCLRSVNTWYTNCAAFGTYALGGPKVFVDYAGLYFFDTTKKILTKTQLSSKNNKNNKYHQIITLFEIFLDTY